MKENDTHFAEQWMHSLINIANLSWENILIAELRKKSVGTDIIFYDTQKPEV
jgi:hypothetical protein